MTNSLDWLFSFHFAEERKCFGDYYVRYSWVNPMIFSILFRCEIERTMSDEKINSKIVWDGVGGLSTKVPKFLCHPVSIITLKSV